MNSHGKDSSKGGRLSSNLPLPSTHLHSPRLTKITSCDTLEKMRAKVPTLRASFTNDEATFKKVYLFTYNFARNPNQRSLQMDTAIEYWKLLFTHRFQKNLEDWIEFLETEYKKSIAKDTWNCMYDFVQFADKDPELRSYDVDG